MRKAEIIKLLRAKVSEKYPQPVVKKAIPEIVDEFLNILKEELKKDEDLIISGFGTFKIKSQEIEKEGEKTLRRIIRFIPARK